MSNDIVGELANLSQSLKFGAQRLDALSAEMGQIAVQAASNAGHGNDFFIIALTVLVLAVFVGYHVVWSVTPALHSPLMAVTNAVSSVIVVGALIAAGPTGFGFAKILGFLAVILASINIFGGFIVTWRMLSMFKKKTR
jgi:NAD(P) transhydrogenase subunit alpha